MHPLKIICLLPWYVTPVLADTYTKKDILIALVLLVHGDAFSFHSLVVWEAFSPGNSQTDEVAQKPQRPGFQWLKLLTSKWAHSFIIEWAGKINLAFKTNILEISGGPRGKLGTFGHWASRPFQHCFFIWGKWMNTCLGKSYSFSLPSLPPLLF